MLKLLVILFFLVSACVAIHRAGMAIGIRNIRGFWSRRGPGGNIVHPFWLLTRLVYGLLMLHLLQVNVWAAFYRLAGCLPDFSTSIYFSAASYSTVGYGDIVLGPEWRILGAVEAVTGVLIFGWSPGVLFTVVHHLYSHYLRLSPPQLPEARTED